MLPKYYKGYRIGSIEKEILKLFLGVNDIEFSPDKKWHDEKWSDIFELARQRRELPIATSRLKEKGLIKFTHKNGKTYVSLTNKGQEYLRENILNIEKLNIQNKVWDGKWHIVIFDIPESRTKIRNILRFHLRKIGFIQVQRSVWVYPYLCNELVALIKANFKLSSEVVYIVANSIEGEEKFMKIFKISRT